MGDTHLWRCIEQHANRRAGKFQAKVSAADISRATGITEQVLSKWRRQPTLPDPELLALVRDNVGVPYNEMLDAALTDRGWLPEPESTPDAIAARRNRQRPPRGPREQRGD